MKKILFSLILSFSCFFAFSNSAQPGLWDAGGTGTFSLLFPEDSAAYQKIQMVKEVVSIQLYNGFAVVKGEYWMYNTTSDTLTIKAGYPLNSYYTSDKSRKLNQVYFDELYDLQVLINQQKIDLLSEYVEDLYSYSGDELDNWYVWKNSFTPLDTTKIEVYFIVNTNNSVVREGYNTDNINAFIYILETGATWKQPILQGDILVQLMEDVSIKDIHGIGSSSPISYDNTLKILKTSFTDLSPNSDDNIVISYGEGQSDFDFNSIVQNSTKYYTQIEHLANVAKQGSDYKVTEFDSPYSTFSFDLFSVLISIIFYLFTYGLPIIGILILAFILYKFLGKQKKNLQKTKL